MRRALLFALYVLGLLAFLEGSLRLAFANEAFFELVASDDDASWRLMWVRNHVQKRSEYEGVDQYSPERGWTLRPGLRGVRLHRGKVSSNSMGLRGVREYAYEKPPGTERIVVIGDSFTFGEEVNDDDTYAARLGELLPGVEVLNLGVHGYGHDQMLLYLQGEGLRYRPDVVVLGFVGIDEARDLLSFRDYAKPYFAFDGGELSLRNVPVPDPDRVLRQELWRSRLLDAGTIARERVLTLAGIRRERRERIAFALLERLRQTIEGAGATPLYLYVATGAEIPRPEPTRHRGWFLSYCEHRALTCVDPTPTFRARLQAGANLKTSGHWDAQEHGLAADAVAAVLRERRLVPTGPPSRG